MKRRAYESGKVLTFSTEMLAKNSGAPNRMIFTACTLWTLSCPNSAYATDPVTCTRFALSYYSPSAAIG